MANTKKYGLIGIGSDVEFGKDGVRFKNNTNVFEARNNADDAYVKIRALAATTGNDVVIYSQLTSAISGLDFSSIRDTAGTTYIDTDENSGTINIVASGTPIGNITSDGIQFGSGARITDVLDEDNMSSNSATAVPTQQSVKAYVDNSIGGLANGLQYMGVFDASAGDYSAIANASQGDFYKINVAGVISGKDWQIGDMLIINQNVTGTPVDAQVDKIDNTESADLLKQTDLTSGQIFIGDGTSTPNARTLTGDVTINSTGVTTIGANKVTYAKFQQTSTSGVVIGRVSSGAGNVEEITIDTDLTTVSANDDTLASAKAIKSYVDSALGGETAANVKSRRVSLVFGSSSPLAVGDALPSNSLVTKVMVNVATVFDGTGVDLTVGDASANNSLMASSEVNLKKVGLYIADCAVLYASSTQVNAYYTADSSSTGAATIILEYHTA